MTINALPPEVPAGAPGDLSPGRIRRTAIEALSAGITPADLRLRGPGIPGEALRLAVAAGIEELTARGVTPRAASRALEKRDRAEPRGGKSGEYGARRVAGIFLTEEMTPGHVRDQARRAEPEYKAMFRRIADAMDALLAEGFDAEALRAELAAEDAAAGGPSVITGEAL